MFFKKQMFFLFCSLSSTLIRAGVAVQGPLVLYIAANIISVSLLNKWMVTGVVGPGGIWGWVQDVGSDPWGTF